MYHVVDAVLLRATTWSPELVFPDGPRADCEGCDDHTGEIAWIRRAWTVSPFAEAVEVASPTLVEAVARIVHGEDTNPRHIRRASGALRRYLARWRHRATPFGLFAGVAPVHLAPTDDDHATTRWARQSGVSTRVDALWLESLISRLEQTPELLGRLTVVRNSTVTSRDARLVIGYRRDHGDRTDCPAEVTVGLTEPIRLVMDHAHRPVTVDALVRILTDEHPSAVPDDARRLVCALIHQGFLVTSLRAPMTCVDPLGHLVGRLDEAQAPRLSDTARVVERLRHLSNRARTGDRCNSPDLAAVMASLIPAAHPVGIDVVLDCTVVLPHLLISEVERAADVLCRLSPLPTGFGHWRAFHHRFLDRYGPEAVVALGDLVDHDTGIGLPASFRGSLAVAPPVEPTPRDHQLLAIAQRAALDRQREVVLTDDMLARLSPTFHPRELPHADLLVQLHAASTRDLDAGDFQLLISGVVPAAGGICGRFLHLLTPAERERMCTALLGLPRLDDDAIVAQLSCPPLHVRTDNVARVTQLPMPLISLGEHQPEETIRLDDLAVTADPERLRLIQMSTGRPVEPSSFNTVEPKHFTHPLARLLCELPRARSSVLGPFSWGLASRLPFLPRLRRGRVVLTPATWRLEAHDLPGPRADHSTWRAALDSWRARYDPPGTVYLGDNDQRLLLCLDDHDDILELRTALRRDGHARLIEGPAPDAYGWLDGHTCELAFPVATETPPASSGPRPRKTVIDPILAHLPGDPTWAELRVDSHPDRVPALLTDHLPRLVSSIEPAPIWWFIRYRDPDHHLRIRFHPSPPTDFGTLAHQVALWGHDLRRRGLIRHLRWDIYQPETGRYGHGAAMTAAEHVFVTDSRATIAQLTLTRHTPVDPQALTAASIVDLVHGFLPGTATRWLIEHLDTSDSQSVPRALHQQAMRLANHDTGRDRILQWGDGASLARSWDDRRDALTSYHATLLACSDTSLDTALASLIHMHCIRMIGIDPDGERRCVRLARAAALAETAGTDGPPHDCHHRYPIRLRRHRSRPTDLRAQSLPSGNAGLALVAVERARRPRHLGGNSYPSGQLCTQRCRRHQRLAAGRSPVGHPCPALSPPPHWPLRRHPSHPRRTRRGSDPTTTGRRPPTRRSPQHAHIRRIRLVPWSYRIGCAAADSPSRR